MKKLCCAIMLMIAVLVGASPLQAADITWVSVITDDVTGADAGFTSLLRSFGHNVTRFFSHTNLTSEEVTQLNAADLVIVSRAVNSGEFDGTSAQIWNEQVTAPVIALSGYTTRRNRMGWFDGDGIPDSGNTPLVAADPSHPVFAGLAFQGDGVTTLDDYNLFIDRGDSTPTNLPVGGSIIATNPAVAGGVAIAEWPAGAVVTDEAGLAMTLAGDRYFFAAGSREANGNAVSTAGKYDLTDTTGLLLFYNTVNYALPAVPEPATGVLTLIGLVAAGLTRRRK